MGDAGEGATNAVKFLQRSFKAKKLAELDPEEFYDFTQTRPYTSRTKDGTRRVKWPTNEFFYWTKPEASSEAMTFLGIEPNLRWRTFAKTLAEVAEEHGVTSVLYVGALLDAVPHTRAIRLTGAANRTEMQDILTRPTSNLPSTKGPPAYLRHSWKPAPIKVWATPPSGATLPTTSRLRQTIELV